MGLNKDIETRTKQIAKYHIVVSSQIDKSLKTGKKVIYWDVYSFSKKADRNSGAANMGIESYEKTLTQEEYNAGGIPLADLYTETKNQSKFSGATDDI